MAEAKKFKAPRGTQDFLPQMRYDLRQIEEMIYSIAGTYGYKEISTPMFEHTELFVRSVGDTSDVVQKEMYTFEDKKGRSITLKPEGTAAAVRMAIEHGLTGGPLPLKYMYFTPCFRYEKQQAGRYRQFHQFGVELFGSPSPLADAEVIIMVSNILENLGIDSVELQINSIGCPKCRPQYHQKLKSYFAEHEDKLCPTCKERLQKNPLRLLDCKEEGCKPIAAGAPIILDCLCGECNDHFENLKTVLTSAGLTYKINPTIVRGLDYYTKTVFEFISTNIGSQGTICGGGRYDGLFEELGGEHLPSVGFAMGLERLLMVIKAAEIDLPPQEKCDIFIAAIGEKALLEAAKYTAELRRVGIMAETDLMNRSLKAQMKYADKIGAKYVVVLGEDELAGSEFNIKNMQTSETFKVEKESFVDEISEIIFAEVASSLSSLYEE